MTRRVSGAPSDSPGPWYRYRGSLPLLGAGAYAAISSAAPFQGGAAYWASLGSALAALGLSPLTRSRRHQIWLGLYLFLFGVVVNLVLFNSPRVVPAPFRVLGWVAYVLSWGGIAPGGRALLLTGSGAELGQSVLESRRKAPIWPVGFLGALSFGLLCFFLIPTGSMVAPRANLLRIGTVLYGLAILRLVSEVLGEAMLRSNTQLRHPLWLVLGWVSGVGATLAALAAAWTWIHERDLVAVVLATLSALLIAVVLRFRRFPRTKIEL